MCNGIMFRVWDKRKGCFLDKSINEFAVLGNGKLIVSDSDWYSEFQNTNPDDYEVSQYTGLKDKNNQLIFFGDIVNTKFGEFAVEYNSGLGCFRLESKDTGFNMLYSLEMEVIGNIYQNADLVK